jgi:hypothetical protein
MLRHRCVDSSEMPMDRLVTLSRALYTGAAALIIGAIAVQILWRTPAASANDNRVTSIPAMTGASEANSTAPSDSHAIDAIVAANVFSSDRAPPKKRYVPPALDGGSGDVITTPAGPRPVRLFGITITPTDAHALIEADPTIPGAEVYRIGDPVRRSRLVELTDSTAVLNGPEGRQVLRLRSSAALFQRPQPPR